jgi:ammonium transporter, Amt family
MHVCDLVIGLIASAVYFGASRLLIKLKIDDPVDAFPVHGACGLWGVLAVGIFGEANNAVFSGFRAVEVDVFASGEQFAIQLVGALAIIAWTTSISTVMFILVKHTIGFRVDTHHEHIGLDLHEHGGKAYPTQYEDSREHKVKSNRLVALSVGESSEKECPSEVRRASLASLGL